MCKNEDVLIKIVLRNTVRKDERRKDSVNQRKKKINSLVQELKMSLNAKSE